MHRHQLPEFDAIGDERHRPEPRGLVNLSQEWLNFATATLAVPPDMMAVLRRLRFVPTVAMIDSNHILETSYNLETASSLVPAPRLLMTRPGVLLSERNLGFVPIPFPGTPLYGSGEVTVWS